MAIAGKLLTRPSDADWQKNRDVVFHSGHSRFVDVDGVRVHYQEAGDENAPALVLTGSIAGDAMADAVEATELFDIDVDQFAGMLALVAANRRGGFERLDAGEAEAPEDAADRSRRDADCSCDVLARPALAA